jgi:hypothetical protein
LLHIGLELHNDEAMQLALKQYEWLLGFNPMQSSFIIGFGNDPIVPVQSCERKPENTIGGLMPGMILLNGELSNHYDPYNQWSICEVGESSAVLFDLLAGFNLVVNPRDSDSELPIATNRTILETKGSLFVSPNPAKNKITISYRCNPGQRINISIYSLQAEKVMTFNAEEREGKRIVDVSELKLGNYFVALSVDGKIANRKSFIIAK